MADDSCSPTRHPTPAGDPLEQVLARVRLVWPGPAATAWMTSANAHLGGSRPLDVLALHGPCPVLDALDAGAWGGAA